MKFMKPSLMSIRSFSAVLSRSAAVVLAIAVAACVTNGTPRPTESATPEASPLGEEVAWVYACNDGTRFTARFEPNQARLFLPGRSVLLAQSASGSGVRYSKQTDAGELVFHTKGAQGILTVPGAPERECTGAKGPGPWELARLAGVNFRAVGHDPDWSLEMGQETGVAFTAEASGGRQLFPWGRPEADGDKAVWNLRSRGDLLTVLVAKRPCQDSVTSETFEASVTVLLGGKTFQGCGKVLGN